jgi:phosphoribosylformimino-5-aminoimidazole carboxamide ribotide isomerase
LQYLHLVDLDGARKGIITNIKVLESIACKTNLKIDFSGGIRSNADIKLAFSSGAAKVTVGSVALSRQDLVVEWMSEYGTDNIILSADCNNRQISVNGWVENSGTDVLSFIRQYRELGATTIMCTDISKDGMLTGPALELYSEILSATEINLIASGGVSSMKDVRRLQSVGCSGVIIGKAIYEGFIKLSELKNYVEETNNTLS